MVFQFFRRQGEVLFFSFFVSEQDGKYGFLIFLYFFFFYGYSFAAFLRQSLQDSFSNPLVIHTIRTRSPFFCPSRQSMRFSMLYVDRHSAGRISGPYLINVTRLIPRQDGQETSADGTGPEEICAKGSRPQRAGRRLRLTGRSAEVFHATYRPAPHRSLP
jgi:hypothetical protein